MNPSRLNRLINQPDALSYLLSNLSEEQIRQRPPSGKWSIFENLAHLGRYQIIFSERLHRILAEDTPVFARYVADDDPEFDDWAQLSFTDLEERTKQIRATLNAFLSSLSQEQLACVGLHPTYGPMAIEGWIEFFLLHEAHHFFTVLKLGGELRQRSSW
jgi:uncharacterized damage-inducible protein DinB